MKIKTRLSFLAVIATAFMFTSCFFVYEPNEYTPVTGEELFESKLGGKTWTNEGGWKYTVTLSTGTQQTFYVYDEFSINPSENIITHSVKFFNDSQFNNPSKYFIILVKKYSVRDSYNNSVNIKTTLLEKSGTLDPKIELEPEMSNFLAKTNYSFNFNNNEVLLDNTYKYDNSEMTIEKFFENTLAGKTWKNEKGNMYTVTLSNGTRPTYYVYDEFSIDSYNNTITHSVKFYTDINYTIPSGYEVTLVKSYLIDKNSRNNILYVNTETKSQFINIDSKIRSEPEMQNFLNKNSYTFNFNNNTVQLDNGIYDVF